MGDSSHWICFRQFLCIFYFGIFRIFVSELGNPPAISFENFFCNSFMNPFYNSYEIYFRYFSQDFFSHYLRNFCSRFFRNTFAISNVKCIENFFEDLISNCFWNFSGKSSGDLDACNFGNFQWFFWKFLGNGFLWEAFIICPGILLAVVIEIPLAAPLKSCKINLTEIYLSVPLGIS